MKQRIQARHKIHQIFMKGIKLTSYIKKEVLKVKNAHYNESNTPQGSNTSASLTVGDSLQHTTIEMVGCDDEFNMIMDKLNQQSKQREIVSIVGMGGIGKTTLAKRIYGDASFISRFDCRALVTISQDYNPIKVLNALLRSLDPTWVEGEEKNELAMRVDKCVKGKRYLIVIDDIWSTNVLDDLLRCFKDGKNGSRMLLTTRLKNVAEYADSRGNLCHNMRFLNLYESWNLFHNQVFSQRITLSPEFERIGREIVKKCKGLPLTINVVAGLLSNSKQDLNEWELIAKNVHKVSIDHSNQQRENIIDLSYTFLPHHLKHCFLSIGCFREDEELAEDFIVDYWVSEGFLKVLRSKSLEDVARESLKDLVDRNLLLISTKIGFNGLMNVYQMHDVLRELALREAQKENLLCLKNDRYFFSVGFRRTQLRNSSHTCSTFLSWTFYSQQFHDHYFKFLRGFVSKRGYALGVRDYDAYASMEFMGLVHLRYLKGDAALKLHSLPLFMLWNLQKLGVDCYPSTNGSLNIWGLPQLKNIHFPGPIRRRPFRLVLPRSVHHNLESIRYLDHRSCTEELFMRIPNLRTLGVMAGCKINLKCKAFNWFESLACLYKLEDLLLCGKLLHPKFSTIHSMGTLSVENFLPNLKRLKLLYTTLNWKNMYVVEMLPKLEVLILGEDAAVGGKWKPTDRGFPRLKFLIIQDCDLQIWKVTGDHFPVLECLVLMRLYDLKQIPSDFADITTLKSIKLYECSKSAISSAKCIQKEKLEYGNDAFTVDILRIDDFDDSLWD
ncbi:putative late blight resistance protein homolog R1A-10 [Ipomoea triloba]|uniref:putative late blight resistance protein homolog R1A-10 n=1 Tax=Ipomoea triloba TaxID=35885 RepID=UPI00125D19EF|nr:putative late blight resistance protein homolog R1A-10 [Ipomoea triloba]